MASGSKLIADPAILKDITLLEGVVYQRIPRSCHTHPHNPSNVFSRIYDIPSWLYPDVILNRCDKHCIQIEHLRSLVFLLLGFIDCGSSEESGEMI
jgi:hypothetical protein